VPRANGGLGELLARRGTEAIVAMPFATPVCLDRETAGYVLPRAAQAGVQWRPNTAVAAIGDHEVILVDVFSRRTDTLRKVDTVVIRTHGLPDDSLYLALREAGPEVIRIGDAVAVRSTDRAIFDGHMAGRRL